MNHGNGVVGGVGGGGMKGNETDCIVEVWAKNMEEEFARIRQIVQEYPYVSMVCSKYY